MDRYRIVETISEQEFGVIAKAINTQTKQRVIIKILRKKFYTWQECISQREIKALRTLQHPHIIAIRELIKQGDELFCVYEHYDQSLFEFYQGVRERYEELSERTIKEIMFQVISAVQHMHSAKFFHRDLSPESISVTVNQPFFEGVQAKLTAFNVTRDLSSRNQQYTDYITTRWYRAPEQLVHSLNYTHKIDIWAIGCIIAELFLLGPLFNGVSEQDQLLRIIQLLGTPNTAENPDFYTFANRLKFAVPQVISSFSLFSSAFPKASTEAIDLMRKILKYNPAQRPSCQEILSHPFFSELNQIPNDYNTPSNSILKQKQQVDEFNKIDGTHSTKQSMDSIIDELIPQTRSRVASEVEVGEFNSYKKSHFATEDVNQQHASEVNSTPLTKSQELEAIESENKSNPKSTEAERTRTFNKPKELVPTSQNLRIKQEFSDFIRVDEHK